MNDISDTTCIVGIDPGSDTLGLAIITFRIPTLELVSIEAQTFIGRKMFDDEGWQSNVMGERYARIQAHKVNLIQLFTDIKPINVACEGPFFSQKRPSAFGSLMEVLSMIREAVAIFDPWRKLYVIDPPTVKKSVGAPGNAMKEVVREKVIALLKPYYIGQVGIEFLDEHSIDAIAVAYCRYVDLKNNIF